MSSKICELFALFSNTYGRCSVFKPSAGKVAAGSVAKTARTWERETPQIASNVKEATGNAAKLTGFLRKYRVVLAAVGAFIAGIASR